MLRSLLLVALAGATLAGPAAHAQITISAADVEASLTRAGTLTSAWTATADGLAALAAQTGPAQTWDFAALAYSAPTTAQVRLAGPSPPGWDDPAFATATHVVRAGGQAASGADSVAFAYYRLTPTALARLGVAGTVPSPDLGVVNARVRYVPGAVQYALPLTFGAAWTSASDMSLVVEAPDFPEMLSRERTEAVVDGWGTLVTPAGSAPALRVTTRYWTESQLDLPGGPVTLRDSSATIEFVTAGGALGATLLLDGLGAPQDAEYGAFTGTVAGEEAPDAGGGWVRIAGASPARAGAAVRVAFQSADAARVEVFDVLGRRVAVLADGARTTAPAEATWHTDGQAPGLYLVRLRAGAQTATTRVVLTD